MTDTQIRMRAHGCDFLLLKDSDGWHVLVRKALDGPRTDIGTKRSARDAESFALTWANRENTLMKDGRPSQLVIPKKPRTVLM